MRGPTGSPVNELALASLVAGDDSEEDEPEEGFGDEGEDDEEEDDEVSRHRSGSTDTDSPGKGRSSPSEHGPKSPPKIAVRGVHTVRGNKDSPQQPQNGGGTTARSGGGMTARTNAASVRSQVSPSRKAAAKASTKLVATKSYQQRFEGPAAASSSQSCETFCSTNYRCFCTAEAHLSDRSCSSRTYQPTSTTQSDVACW
jgi:hypothetical protein